MPPPRRRVSREPALWLGAAATLSTVGAITIAYLVRPPQTEWSAVLLWVAGTVLWCLACRAPANERALRMAPRPTDLAVMAALVLVAAALILPALSVYPLEVAGDPVRDGGLMTRGFVDGTSTEIFQYGFYNGYSLLVPFLGVPFYFAFGASSLVFKGVAALAGLAAPPLLYAWARRFLPTALAATAALLMIAQPVYLFYARSEPVVALNPLVMIAVLAALVAALDRDAAPRHLGLLGLTAGVSVYFHAAMKAPAFIALALAGLVTLWRSCTGQQPWRRTLTAGALALLGVMIGFGPLLLVTDFDLFISRQRLVDPSQGLRLPLVLDLWVDSLRVFFDRPTTSWFPKHQPLIPSPGLSGLFALGAVLGFLALPARVYCSLVLFVLALTLTNSAITDEINGDHRLAPLLPVIGMIMAAALGVLWRAARWVRSPAAIRVAQGTVVVLALAAAAPPVYRFFAQEQAKKPDFTLHLVHLALREIESTPALRAAPEICVGGNGWVTGQLRLRHILEGLSFYLPDTLVNVAELRSTSPTDGIYLSDSCEPKESDDAWRVRVFCSEREPFICPSAESSRSEVHVYVDAALAAPR